jgi:hypothetical protein
VHDAARKLDAAHVTTVVARSGLARLVVAAAVLQVLLRVLEVPGTLPP